MTKNLGSVDRIIRILLAIIIGVLYATGDLSGTAALILGVLGVVFLLTSSVGFCPIYHALKLSTKKSTPSS